MDIIARILNFSIMIAFPVGLGVFLSRKLRTEWRLFGIGAVTFIGSQVFHIPFNAWVLNPILERFGFDGTEHGLQLGISALALGLSAGVFEEIARYLGYRFWLKEDRDWKSALMFGAGHGGIESILLGVLVLYGFIQAVSLKDADLTAVINPENLEIARIRLEAYWAAPWHLAILGAVERLATICFHLSATVLVLQSFRRKNSAWLFAAIGWHTLLDATAVFASQTWSPYITEGIILGFGLISLMIVFRLKSTDQSLVQESPKLEPAIPEIQPVSPSKENLEDSRYV